MYSRNDYSRLVLEWVAKANGGNDIGRLTILIRTTIVLSRREERTTTHLIRVYSENQS